MVPEPNGLIVACSSANTLQRYLPAVFTIENFWSLRGKRDFSLVHFPRELCRSPDKKTRYTEAPQESDGTATLQLSIRVAIVELDGTIKFFDEHELPSIFVLSGNYWLSLSRGEPIKLLVNFLRLPSDFEGTARKYVFQVRLYNISGVDTKGEITLESNPLPATSSSPKRTLKRSTEGDNDRQGKKKKIQPTEAVLKYGEWKEFFLNCGVRNSSDISAYASIMMDQRIVDENQLSRIPIELLQQIGFKLADIARLRDYLYRLDFPNNTQNSDSNSDSETENGSGSSALSSPSIDSSDDDVEFSNYEEEIAVQLLLLYESNPPSPSAAILQSVATASIAPAVVTPTPPSTINQTPLSMNQVVHLTIKLGKLIICEVKDPSVDLKSRLVLAEEVESLLNQWVSMMYPNQKSLTLEDIREMTEQPSPPYDLPLAYYVKVFSLHLQLKDNNRGILKREHLLLPMEDVAKLLSLSLTKISREYQRGCVLTCGWLLKGRKRSLRWPSRPLHVLLGHISEKILRETPSLDAPISSTLSLTPSSSSLSTSQSGVITRSISAATTTTTQSSPSKPQTHLALLASTAIEEPHHTSSTPVSQPINCY